MDMHACAMIGSHKANDGLIVCVIVHARVLKRDVYRGNHRVKNSSR